MSKSLKVAVSRSELHSNEDDEFGDVATGAGPSQHQTRSPSVGRQSTPIPNRRTSIARARQSFGIFLDDDITSGKDLGDRFGVNQDDELDRSYPRISVGDGASPQSSSPDGDLTQDLTHISALMDKDESAMNDNAAHPPTSDNSTPQLPSVTDGRSPMNSRKSLAYVGNKKLVFGNKRDDFHGLTNRLSIAPIGAEYRADQVSDQSPEDSFQEDQTLHVGNILDRLEHDEEEERRAIDVRNTNPRRSIGDSSLLRPVLPENRKLFDLEAAEETIHYYDLDGGTDTMKTDSQVEREISGPQEQQTHSSHVVTQENPTKEFTPQQQQTYSPPNEVGPQQQQTRSPSNQVATQEQPTHPLPNEVVPQQQQIHAPPIEVAPRQQQVNSPRVVSKENHATESTRDEQTHPEKAHPPQVKPLATPVVENQSEDGMLLATPLPDAGVSSKSAAETCRPPTPHSATGLKIRAGLKEGMSVSKRSQADSQLQELSNSVLRGSKRDCVAPKSAIPSKIEFTVSEFLAECNVHFDKTFAVDQREASIIGPTSSDIDRTSMQSRILESVKREKILRRLQEEATKQAKVVEELEHRIQKLEDELVGKMPPAYALVSRGNSLSSREMSAFRVNMKRLRKVSSLQVRMEWVLSRQQWEGAIRDEIQQVLKEGERYVSEVVSSEGAYGKLNRKFKEVLREKGVQYDLGELDDSAAVVPLRKEVDTEFAYISDLKKLVMSKKETEADLQRKKNYFVDRTAAKTESVKKLRAYAGAMASNNLNAKVTERAELNMVVSRIAGFRPHFITPNGIKSAVADLLDLELRFDGDVVTNVAASPYPVDARHPVIQTFVEGAVMASRRSMQALTKVRDVPFALYVCRERLSSLKLFLLNLSRYFDRHLGELANSHLHEDETSSTVDVSFRVSFFSLSKWTKFDVAVKVSTVIPKQFDGTLSQELKLDGVTKFIGAIPAVETLDNIIQEAGFQRDGEMFNAVDAFAAVWELLDSQPSKGVISSLNS